MWISWIALVKSGQGDKETIWIHYMNSLLIRNFKNNNILFFLF